MSQSALVSSRSTFWLAVYLGSLLYGAVGAYGSIAERLPEAADSARAVQVRLALLLGTSLAPLRAVTGALAAALVAGAIVRALGARERWIVPFKAAAVGEFASTVTAALLALLSLGAGDWVLTAASALSGPSGLSPAVRQGVVVIAAFLAPTTIAYGIGFWRILSKSPLIGRSSSALVVVAVVMVRTAAAVVLARAVSQQ